MRIPHVSREEEWSCLSFPCLKFDLFWKGEKGSHGEKGSEGKDGPQGQKGKQGPRGMPGTCDAKVFASRYLGVSWCGYCFVSFQSFCTSFRDLISKQHQETTIFPTVDFYPIISYIFHVIRTPPEGMFRLSTLQVWYRVNVHMWDKFVVASRATFLPSFTQVICKFNFNQRNKMVK